MSYLLDTHVFLWWILDDPRLNQNARGILKESQNEIYISSVSIWEISIKVGLKRLKLPSRSKQFFQKEISKNNFSVLSITIEHSLAIMALPKIHRDPFDRMLIAQAMEEKLTLITDDKIVKKYKVKTVS